VLQENHGIVIANRRFHQSLGIRRCRGQSDLQSGRPHDQVVRAIRVLSSPSGGKSITRLENNRNFDVTSGHVAQAWRFVDHLIEGNEHEFTHPQLDDRP